MTADNSRQAEILDLTHDGKGVADIEGRRVFVSGALVGEEVRIELKKGRRRNKNDLEALEIARASANRVEPGCEYFGRCGACAIQHMSYGAQLAFKQQVVAQAFSRIGGLQPTEWLEPVASPQWAYRRRARLGARYVEGKGRALVGFRERAAPYVTDMNHCPVLVPPIGNAIGDLASTLTLARSARRIPQFEVAIGDAAGALVVRALDPLPVEDETLFLEFGKKLDLDVYVQTGGPGTVRPLAQARTLFYSLNEFDVRIEFAPTDFIQVNAIINKLMVKEAVDVSGIGATDKVLDLFCGVGNFSLPFARKAARVVGVEGDAGLVARAAKNAELNKLDNCQFITADLMQGGWSVLREPWDVVVLDPPRSGAAALGSDWAAMSPRRIVYVSCHPATLARDAKVLSEEHGYVMSTARVFDMFPNTHHAEVMAVFDRQ